MGFWSVLENSTTKTSHFRIYCYGIKNLTTSLLAAAVKRFVQDSGVKPGLIRTNFDHKHMAGEVEAYLIKEKIQ